MCIQMLSLGGCTEGQRDAIFSCQSLDMAKKSLADTASVIGWIDRQKVDIPVLVEMSKGSGAVRGVQLVQEGVFIFEGPGAVSTDSVDEESLQRKSCKFEVLKT